jgi:hypothetical protein
MTGSVFLDDLSRISVPVFVALYAAARIAFATERVDIALLRVGPMLVASFEPASQHAATLPARR